MFASRFGATALLTVGLVFSAGFAQASQITFTTQATFSAAAGALTTENFDSTAAAILASGGAFSTAFPNFTLSGNGNGDFVAIAAGTAAGNINGTNFLYMSETLPGTTTYSGDGGAGPTITFTFSQPMTAFGFSWTDTDPTDSYQIAVNAFTYTTPPFSTNGTASGFFGVVAGGGETFTTVVFTQNAAGGVVDPFGIDNVQFSSTAPVPEPTSLLLLGTGLVGAGVRRYRQRSVRK